MQATDGRALSFYDLSVGEALAPRRSRGEQRRGQVSLADKSSKKTSPGVPEPEKRLHSPGITMNSKGRNTKSLLINRKTHENEIGEKAVAGGAQRA